MRSPEVLTAVIDASRPTEGISEPSRQLFEALNGCLTEARNHDTAHPDSTYFFIQDPLKEPPIAIGSSPEATEPKPAEAASFIGFSTPRGGAWTAGRIMAPDMEGHLNRNTGEWQMVIGRSGNAASPFNLRIIDDIPFVIIKSDGTIGGASRDPSQLAPTDVLPELTEEQKLELARKLGDIEGRLKNPYG